MFKELLSYIAVIAFVSIILAVSIPPVVLEPVGWLLNTDIEVHKYGNAGLTNQSATFFEFYIANGDGYFSEVSIPILIALSVLVFIPISLLLITAFSLHLKAKSITKETRKGYALSLFESITDGKLKPSFWLIFCPFLAAIYFVKTDLHTDINDIIRFDFSFSQDRLYQPAFLLPSEVGLIHWKSYTYQSESNRHIQKDGVFSSSPKYSLKIIGQNIQGDTVFDFERPANHSLDLKQFGETLIFIDTMGVTAIDTHNTKLQELNLNGLAKQNNPNFTEVTTLSYNARTDDIQVTDSDLNTTSLNIRDILLSHSARLQSVNFKRVQGKDRKVKRIVKTYNGDQLVSREFIEPKVLSQTDSTSIIESKSKTSATEISQINSDLKEDWAYSLNKYHPNLPIFRNKICNDSRVSQSGNVLAISYGFINMTCATEFIDSSNGLLVAKSIFGELELLSSGSSL